MTQLRNMAARALLIVAGLALLSTSAYAEDWKTEGKYQTKSMGRGYSDPQSTRYDPANKVVYLDDQGRARFKLEFKSDPDGRRRAYLPDGSPLDTRVNGQQERAIFVMDAEGSIYVLVNGPLQGRTQHSTIPAGKPVAAAGQIMAADGVIEYLDNSSGHYEPTNALLIQAIQSLEEQGVRKGTYKVNFDHYDAVPPNYLALDPQGQEKVSKGDLIPYEGSANTNPTAAEGRGRETGGRNLSPAEAYPDVPEKFYRVGMLKWNDTPLDDAPGGVMKRTGTRQEFNLFPSIEGARFFAHQRYRGNDRTIYELRKEDLAKTAEGREFLERAQRSINQNRAEIEKLRQEGKFDAANRLRAQLEELAIYMTTEQSFKETVLANARAVEQVNLSQPQDYNEDIIPDSSARASERPATEPIAREVQPGPVAPELETKIENYLRSLDLQKLGADRDAGNFEVFKNPLFAREPGEAGDKVARAWKKVCSKSEFAKHSALLAEMRWKMLVSVFSEVAQAHGIKLQLIDSGKRNAYRSDVDVTVYAPGDSGGGKALAAAIADAEGRIKAMTGGHDAQTFDVTIHNGDLFVPNIRNSAQSVEEYQNQLHEAVGKLRLKVTSNGDASYFPGAQIEDAQKRGLRDGTVTELAPEVEVVSRAADGTPTQTRFKKPQPKEFRAAEIGPNGAIIANTERFAGEPLAYDRSNALSALAQNLEKVFRNGDKPGDLAKLFNRGMNLGAGAGEVNSFIDIHVSDLPSGDNLSPEEAARIAIETQRVLGELAETKDKSAREAKQNQLNELTSKGRNKAVAKMRWIMRSFRYEVGNQDKAALTRKLLSLYDLLNTSAAIEIEKGKGNFDWNKDRARFLERYIERLKRTMPDVASTPKGVELLQDEAYRAFCDDVVKTLEEALVTLEVEAMRDLTPDRIERFRQKGGGPAQGEGVRLEKIAKKLAEQRRVELALLLDVINTYVNKSRFDTEYKDVAKDQAARLEKLRERILNAVKDVDPDIAIEVEKLSRQFAAMKEESLGEFTPSGKPPATTDEVITAREAAAKRLAETGPEAVKDETLREYIKDQLLKIYNPADGPLLQQMFNALETGLGGSITHAPYTDKTTGEVVTPRQGGALAETLKGNLSSPLMVGSSVVSMGRAYVTGGDRALKEAAIGEAFNFLPPTYGVIGIAFKDFARGKYEEGARSLAWLGGIHVAEHFVPGVGQALLIYNIATGVPEIIYTYTTEKINSDMVEQALRSQRVQGKRAARNPFKDSTDFFRGDTPEYPVFWDNPCMKEPEDNLTIEERVPLIAPLYMGAIAEQLKQAKLDPKTPAWYEEQYRLLRKYAFDHPYYQRMSKIYDCFYPQVKALKDKGFDEDNVLRSLFGKEVLKWFSKQPDGYQMEFSFDVGRQTEHGEETRKRLLGAITNQVIAEYHKNEYETYRRIEVEQAARAAQEKADRLKNAVKQMIGSLKAGGDRLQQKLENYILGKLRGSSKEVSAQVQVKAPTWYVNMSGVLKTETSYTLDKGKFIAGGQGRVTGEEKKDGPPAMADAGNIPIDVAARVDRAKNPDENSLKHDFKLTLAKPVERGKPAGFIPNAEESKLLAEVGPDGKPKNDIFTINLVASATVYGSQGQSLGQSKPAPVVGYVIGEVPRFSGQIAVIVHAPKPNLRGQIEDAGITYEAKIDKEVRRGRASSTLDKEAGSNNALFDNLNAGTYQVTVTPLYEGFSPATATFTLKDLYTKAAYDSNAETANPSSVEVTLPYKKPDTAANGQQGDPSQPGQDAGKTTAQKPPLNPPGGRKPGGQGGQGGSTDTTQKTLQACLQLAAQAQQFLAAGDMASAANALQQAKLQGCAGLDPNVDQAINGAQGNLDNQTKTKAGETKQRSAACDYEGALAEARELMRANPAALAGIDIAQLQLFAEAQRQARALLEAGKAAIERNDLNGAIAALQAELAVPNLPECMRAPAKNLLGDLTGRKTFNGLIPKVDDALSKCDSKQAVQLVGQITNISPRTDVIQAWLNEYAPRIAQIQTNERDAMSLIDQARAKRRAIKQTDDLHTQVALDQQANALIRQAKQKIAPCVLQLGPADDETPDLDPDDLFPKGKKESPTDDVPGALDPGKPKNQQPTDDVPGALDPGKKSQPPTDDVPGALDPGKKSQPPTDDVPGALDPAKAQPPPGSDGQQTGKKEGTQRDPNKPSTKQKIGIILGGVINEIERQRTNHGGGNGGGSGGGGNSGGGRGGPGNSGGTGGQGGGTNSGQEADLSGTWNATYREPMSGTDCRFQMVLSRVAAGKWQGPLDYNCGANLNFKTQATIQATGPGKIHLSYNTPRDGVQQADGTFTSSQMTFGGAVTYTKR